MKVTPLHILVSEIQIVDGQALVFLSRLPRGDELIGITREGWHYAQELKQQPPCELKLLGQHPKDLSYVICIRSDSGLFWRTVAIAKYKLLLAECKLTDTCLKHLYLWGMLVCPRGEEFSRKHLRLDWLLIGNAIAVFGLTGCAIAWLLIGGYWQAVCCLVLSWLGMASLGVRRNWLVERRDLELRETSLRALFQSHQVTPTTEEFEMCVIGWTDASDIIAIHQVKAKLKDSNVCHYYSHSSDLRCAVHPDHYGLGMCNENCPSFRPIDNQQES
jgi:hypothetical protein